MEKVKIYMSINEIKQQFEHCHVVGVEVSTAKIGADPSVLHVAFDWSPQSLVYRCFFSISKCCDRSGFRVRLFGEEVESEFVRRQFSIDSEVDDNWINSFDLPVFISKLLFFAKVPKKPRR